jgi:HAMP domain-containing protein
MKLALKFNLVFAVVFLLGLGAAGTVSRRLLQKNARDEVVENARLILEAALASRAYTSSQIAPLLSKLGADEFLPQTVPAFGATEQFNTLHAKFPDFAYKEATLNPTNPRDRASDWEVDVVDHFRQYGDATEQVGQRDTPSGPSLYLARPIRITNDACLKCHSTIDVAPKALLARYGPANGFGWKMNEVIGAQVVSVPMALPLQHADTEWWTFMASLGIVFLVILVALNVMLRLIVVRPVTQLASLADQVSLGKFDAADFPATGKDEVSVLAQAFSRMKKSLAHAMKMLESDGGDGP